MEVSRTNTLSMHLKAILMVMLMEIISIKLLKTNQWS